jgi:hypothetical protein
MLNVSTQNPQNYFFPVQVFIALSLGFWGMGKRSRKFLWKV